MSAPTSPLATRCSLSSVDQRTHACQHGGRARKSGLPRLDPIEHFLDLEHTLGDLESAVAREREERIARHAVKKGAVEAARRESRRRGSTGNWRRRSPAPRRGGRTAPDRLDTARARSRSVPSPRHNCRRSSPCPSARRIAYFHRPPECAAASCRRRNNPTPGSRARAAAPRSRASPPHRCSPSCRTGSGADTARPAPPAPPSRHRSMTARTMSASCAGIRLGQHQLPRALAHALDVPVHAEGVHGAVGMPERLEALEARARIVQHVRRRRQLDRPDRLELRRAPATVAIRSGGHVRREESAERGSLLRLRRGRFRLCSHGEFTLGMKIIAGCSRSSFNA